jgi:hypothetical protein
MLGSGVGVVGAPAGAGDEGLFDAGITNVVMGVVPVGVGAVGDAPASTGSDELAVSSPQAPSVVRDRQPIPTKVSLMIFVGTVAARERQPFSGAYTGVRLSSDEALVPARRARPWGDFGANLRTNAGQRDRP